MLSPSWKSQGVYIVRTFFYHSLFSLLVLYIALKSLVQKLDCRLEKSEASGSKRKVGFLRYQRKNSYPHSDSLPNDAPPWSYQRSRTQVCLLIFLHHAHILWKLFYIYISRIQLQSLHWTQTIPLPCMTHLQEYVHLLAEHPIQELQHPTAITDLFTQSLVHPWLIFCPIENVHWTS